MNAIRSHLTRVEGGVESACFLRITIGAEILAESTAPAGKKVEHWGDPHQNLTFAISAGELTLTIRAAIPAPPATTTSK